MDNDVTRRYSPAALAFYGDAVYGRLARKLLVGEGNRPAGELHSRAVALVCAPTQAAGAEVIAPLLTEEEAAVYRRGRNAKVGHTPKGATDAEYHAATGLEALFGWLDLCGRTERAEELFNAMVEGLEKE